VPFHPILAFHLIRKEGRVIGAGSLHHETSPKICFLPALSRLDAAIRFPPGKKALQGTITRSDSELQPERL
jgi:hypothetical protein